MTLNFTHEELSYLVKRFGYKQLEGFDLTKFKDSLCEESLLGKGYITSYKKSFELSNDVRIFLSTWANIRYTLVSNRYIDDNNVFAVFANSDRMFTYSYHSGDIQISFCDFSPEVMDTVIADYLYIREFNDCSSKFNMSFSGDDYLSLFGEGTPNEIISQKTGLSTEDVALIKQTLDSEDAISFIVQDVKEDIGCMGMLKKYSHGYVLVKHVVPNRNMMAQKVVAVKGNSQDIIDSIYIL